MIFLQKSKMTLVKSSETHAVMEPIKVEGQQPVIVFDPAKPIYWRVE